MGVNILFIALYSIRDTIDVNTLFNYTSLVGFIGLYFITAYCKLYLKDLFENKKQCSIILLSGVAFWIAQVLALDFIGLRIGYFSDKLWYINSFKNPAYILIAIGAFGLANGKCFYNKGINYLSSLSMLIYIIHANRIITDYVRYDLFEHIYNQFGFDKLLLWCFAYAAVLIIGSVIASAAYHETVYRLVNVISDKAASLTDKIINEKIKKIIYK